MRTMTRHRYKVVFSRDEDDAIIANCPTLQGVRRPMASP